MLRIVLVGVAHAWFGAWFEQACKDAVDPNYWNGVCDDINKKTYEACDVIGATWVHEAVNAVGNSVIAGTKAVTGDLEGAEESIKWAGKRAGECLTNSPVGGVCELAEAGYHLCDQGVKLCQGDEQGATAARHRMYHACDSGVLKVQIGPIGLATIKNGAETVMNLSAAGATALVGQHDQAAEFFATSQKNANRFADTTPFCRTIKNFAESGAEAVYGAATGDQQMVDAAGEKAVAGCKSLGKDCVRTVAKMGINQARGRGQGTNCAQKAVQANFPRGKPNSALPYVKKTTRGDNDDEDAAPSLFAQALAPRDFLAVGNRYQ